MIIVMRRRSESFLFFFIILLYFFLDTSYYKHTIMTHNNAFTIIYIYFCLLFSSVLLVSSLNCDLHCIHSNTLCYWHHWLLYSSVLLLVIYNYHYTVLKSKTFLYAERGKLCWESSWIEMSPLQYYFITSIHTFFITVL